jgi:hypothetical protein
VPRDPSGFPAHRQCDLHVGARGGQRPCPRARRRGARRSTLSATHGCPASSRALARLTRDGTAGPRSALSGFVARADAPSGLRRVLARTAGSAVESRHGEHHG